jgi:ubiquinone/menaquinone biosynthesis C-methylase UbiE
MTIKELKLAGTIAGAVFDRLAASYDDQFTQSLIGRAQRNAVWKVLRKAFHSGDRVLELNCGTGEDAFFLSEQGVSTLGCDASQHMIARAEQRLQHRQLPSRVAFRHLPTERIGELAPESPFDGAFSNFSGLNCVADLASTATDLSTLVKTGGSLVLCFSTRFCLVEILHYSSRAQWRKALRRCSGRAKATLGGADLTIFYPTLRDVRRSFAPHFRLRSLRGVGVAIPPSYLEPWVRSHPTLFRAFCRLESALARLPLLRISGDHMLLVFEKVSP